MTLAEAHAICDQLLPANAAYVLSVGSWRHAHEDWETPGIYRHNFKISVSFFHVQESVRFEEETIAKVMEKVEAKYRPQPGLSLEETISAAVGGL